MINKNTLESLHIKGKNILKHDCSNNSIISQTPSEQAINNLLLNSNISDSNTIK